MILVAKCFLNNAVTKNRQKKVYKHFQIYKNREKKRKSSLYV